MPKCDPETNKPDSPVYWFVVLDIAVERGDLATAAEAVEKLKGHGVDVRYRRPRHPQPQREACNAKR